MLGMPVKKARRRLSPSAEPFRELSMILRNPTPARPTAAKTATRDAATRIRLAQFQHSTDPQAAAIATATALLLPLLTRIVEAMECQE